MDPGIIAVVMVFSIPITAIYTSHRRQMMEMKLKMHQGTDENVASELREIKQQLVSLRDTTTQYDMSFDVALQRMESRLGHLEQRVGEVEQTAQVNHQR